MKKLLYILPFLSLAFISCEQDANVDVPEVDPKLVICCFITPQDTILRAKIDLSNPVFNSGGNANDSVTDATVTLYGNSSSIVLTYNSTTRFYEAPASAFPIYAGNEYRIVVSVPSGLQADASTIVPLAPPANFTSTIEETILYQDQWSTNARIDITYAFDETAGQKDYYRFLPYEIRRFSTSTSDTATYRAGWELFTDDNADGQHLERNYTFEFYSYGDTVVAVDLYLIRGNYEYYSFHRSLEIDGSGGDNPFSEPVLMYTNVNNGFGCFGAANGVKVRHWR